MNDGIGQRFGAAGRNAVMGVLLASAGTIALATPAFAQTATPQSETAPADTATGEASKLPAQPVAQDPDQTSASTTDQADAATNDIVVTGIRRSLQSSLDSKRRAQNFVDSISAEEAGKFPDNNLAESLQRIAGVTVARNYGLGQQISVRGLGPDFSNVLLNGRSLPSDTGAYAPNGGGRGRSFNFDVLPSEMISRVDINKTTMPQLTEGGIGSTIDIITPRPLDSGKTFLTLVATGNLVQRRNTVTPTVVGIGSWVNKSGDFGVAVAGSFTNILASTDSVRVDQWDGLPRAAGDTRPRSTFNVITGTGNNLVASKQALAAPRQMSYARLSGGTKRYFGSGTVQYRPAPNVTLTADGLYSHLKQQITESQVHPAFGNTIINPTVGSDGVLTAGTFPGQAALSSAAVQAAIAAFNVANPTNTISVSAPQALSVIRERDRDADTYQVGLNGKWEASSNLLFEGDVAYSKATGSKPFDPYALIGRYAQGNVGFALDDSRNPVASLNDAVYSDASLVRVGYSGNWGQDVKDDLWEGRLAGKWHSEDGVLRGVEVGGDYQDHSKGLDNYYANANPYDGLTFAPDPAQLDIRSFSGFLDGKVAAPVNSFFGYDPKAFYAYLSQPAQLARCTNNCSAVTGPNAISPYALIYDAGGSFKTREKVAAGYVDLKLGGEWWSVNGGLRVVHVSTQSSGVVGALVSAVPNSAGGYTVTTGTGAPASSSASYTSVLPSANLKINATEKLVFRLAAGKTLTRADLNDLRYSLNFGTNGAGNFALDAGNPGLKPQYGKNYDAAVEWYVSKLSYVSAAAFRKDLTNLFGSLVTPNTPTSQFAPGVTNAPTTLVLTQISNIGKGRVQGIEAAGQFAFDDSFGVLSGFGASGNYTYVDATTEASNGCLPNISPHSYNASGFYDNGKVQLRAAYNWRSTWKTTCDFDGAGTPLKQKAYGQLDLSFRGNLTDRLQIFADVVNLTNTRNRSYFLNNVPIQIDVNYRRVDFGMRVSF